jgi:tRNA (guanine-N7-)-methyltransferase
VTAPTIPTFKLRRGRVTSTQASALARMWPRLGVTVDGSQLDLPARFGRCAPVVLEVGFGMGEATWQMAAAAPERDLLAVDVHTPGIGSLLKLIEAHRLTNVRVADGDAVQLLRDMLAADTLSEVRIFFPDPWPKTRHTKRRLVTTAFCDLVGTRLWPGGLLHVATDSRAYADRVRGLLTRHDAFALIADEDVPPRPTTRFEQQARDAGRRSYDVAARRV